MTEWQHTDSVRGRWQRLTLAEQFGNIGSEISRAARSGPAPSNSRATFASACGRG
jgi:hypothetical protein